MLIMIETIIAAIIGGGIGYSLGRLRKPTELEQERSIAAGQRLVTLRAHMCG
jgi:hypothetical protein